MAVRYSQDSFTYTVNDGVNTSTVATVVLTIAPANDNAPVALDDAYVVLEGDDVSGTGGLSGTGLQGNDSDADLPGDTISVSEVNGVPGNVGSPVVLSTGTVTVDADGSFSYTHNGDEVFSDSFTYALSDGINSSGTVLRRYHSDAGQ